MVESDVYIVRLPRRVVEEAVKRGFDIESLVVESVMEKLGMDPREEALVHLELAEHFFEEAREYIEKGDAVQASEKLYKVAEECIKALAKRFEVPELKEVRRRGKWDTWLLGMAATSLAEMLSEEQVRMAWSIAYDIHVWGFHEAKYGLREVKHALPHIEWLLRYTKEKLSTDS